MSTAVTPQPTAVKIPKPSKASAILSTIEQLLAPIEAEALSLAEAAALAAIHGLMGKLLAKIPGAAAIAPAE